MPGQATGDGHDASPDAVMARIEGLLGTPPTLIHEFTVDPIVAARLLERRGTDRRPPKASRVSGYAKDMAEGGWVETRETIKFSDTGRLVDGRARLMACVESGKPFLTYMLFGLRESDVRQIDRGGHIT